MAKKSKGPLSDISKRIDKGAFSAKASKAGMSTAEYARHVASSPTASTKTKRQSALARTFAKYRPRTKGRKTSR